MHDAMRNVWREIGGMIAGAILVVVAALLIGALTGCGRKTVYVPMESVRTEYKEADTTGIYNRLLRLFESRNQKEVRSDSLFDRTKETVILRENGDTARHDTERIVYRATNHEKELEQKLTEQDSIIQELRTQLSMQKTDSIQVPYPVERALTKWEKTKMDFGGIAIGGLGASVVLIAILAWLAKKRRE